MSRGRSARASKVAIRYGSLTRDEAHSPWVLAGGGWGRDARPGAGWGPGSRRRRGGLRFKGDGGGRAGGRAGDAAALRVALAAREAVTGVESFCREQGVNAWFRRAGYLQVSTAPAQDRTWEETLAGCRELGVLDAVQPLT